MKLANEIVREAYSQHGYGKEAFYPDDHTDKTGIDIQETELVSTIAAKLKPIREAVELGLGIAQEHDGEWDYTKEIHILQSALALLSEEESFEEADEPLSWPGELEKAKRVATQIAADIQKYVEQHGHKPTLIEIGAGEATCFLDTYNAKPCYSSRNQTLFGIPIRARLMDGWILSEEE